MKQHIKHTSSVQAVTGVALRIKNLNLNDKIRIQEDFVTGSLVLKRSIAFLRDLRIRLHPVLVSSGHIWDLSFRNPTNFFIYCMLKCMGPGYGSQLPGMGHSLEVPIENMLQGTPYFKY